MLIKLIQYVTVKRFAELSASCIALSAAISLLCGAFPDRSFELVIGLYIAVALFVSINIKMMRRCCFELKNTTGISLQIMVHTSFLDC